MRDVSETILAALVTQLDSIGLEVYSFVPDNETKPFIFIGEVSSEEVEKKDGFRMRGTFVVSLSTGTIAKTGSLADSYTYYNNIKQAIQPNKGDVLDLSPTFDMVYLKQLDDSGLFEFVPGDRIFTGEIVYEFETVERVINNVIFGSNNVIFETQNVVQ